MQRKIGAKVIILGGGRWGQVTYNNLIKLKLVNKIILISRRISLKKNILENKNVNIYRNFNFEKYKKFNLIIICKNNHNKINYLKKLSKFKNKVVIEKPLIIKKNIKVFLKLFEKKNYYISLPWYFEYNLKKIYNNLLRQNKINRIKFIWYDNNKKKYGLRKNFDKKIYYIEDVFSHLFSILNLKTSNLKSLKFKQFKIIDNVEYLSFLYNKIEVQVECSNKIKKNQQDIFFYNNENILFKFLFSDKIFRIFDSDNRIIHKSIRALNGLKYQYEYLLSERKKNYYKKICYFQILYQNQLYNLIKQNFK